MGKNHILSKIISYFLKEEGKRTKRIFEPSKGGIGTKLKTARRILAKTIIENKLVNELKGKKRIIKPKIKATKKLANGPATATKAGPYF